MEGRPKNLHCRREREREGALEPTAREARELRFHVYLSTSRSSVHARVLFTLSVAHKHQLRLTFVPLFTCSTNATFRDPLFIRAAYGSSLFHLP